MRTRLLLALGCCYVLLVVSQPTSAAVELPSIIGEHMILQRDTLAPIWGWDAPGTTVMVSFRGQTATAKASADGRWLARIPAGTAGGPFSLSIQGTSKTSFNDVMVGEVWVAGGQSNMWWSVANSKDAAKEIEAATDPTIRVYDANTGPREAGWRAETPQKTIATEWKINAPQNAGEFPATAYFFARELHQALGVPIGIVHVGVPGAEIEAFLPHEWMQINMPDTLELLDVHAREYPELSENYDLEHLEWEQKKADAQKKGEKVPDEPKAPEDPKDANSASRLWNGTVAPTAPFGCRGFLWWQGEANTSRQLQYRVLFPSLIEEWRHAWDEDDAPFLFVELANFGTKQDQPSHDDGWSVLRDAQKEALRLPLVYEVSTIDILDPEGPIWNIHPKDKQLAGHRLFLAAMANVYGQRNMAWSGPVFKSATFAGNAATITFDHVEGGLKIKDGAELKGFAVAGSDRKWFWAEARIQGDTVVLRSTDVPRPVAVRYAWHINPIGNLVNGAGLPAFPFRTDHWSLVPQ